MGRGVELTALNEEGLRGNWNSSEGFNGGLELLEGCTGGEVVGLT